MEFEHKVGALDDEDLVAVDREEKNWKGIVISLLVIGSILGAIIVAIILCTPTGDVDNNRMKLDFEHIVSDTYKVQVFNGTWLSEHEIVYVDQNGSIVIFDAATNKSSSMLVKTYDKTLHTMAGFKLSADRQSILFVSDRRHEFGAPISARYAIFNISSQTVEFLDDLIKTNSPMKTPHIQYASWGPVSNSIVFIESNDIYYIPDFSHNSAHKYLRLTKTGASSQAIKNGLPDSLYRNSIFNQENEATLWFSPDGRYLSYLTFDDSAVEPTPIELYDTYAQESGSNPTIHYEYYPRAGTVNPNVSLHIVDLTSSSATIGSATEEIEIATILPPADLLRQQQEDPRLGYYITYVGWFPIKNELLVMWVNRAQNSSILSLCTNENESKSVGSSLFGSSSRGAAASAWKCNILTSFSQDVPPSTDVKRTILTAYDKNGTRLIFLALPRPDSKIGAHYHIAMLRANDRAAKYLTYGDYDIDRLLSYNPERDTLYFEVEGNELAERHLFEISSIAKVAARKSTCLTCKLKEPCGYNRAHISPGSKYLVHECLGPSIPVTRMMRLLDSDDDGASASASNNQENANNYLASDGNGENENEQELLVSQYVLGTNEQLKNLEATKQMPIEKFLTIKTGPHEVHIKLYLPNEIEEEKDKRFPLLIESTEIDKRNVWKKYEIDWGKYLASRKQLIYAKIDCVRRIPTSVGASIGGFGGGASSDHEEQSTDSPQFNSKDQIEAIKFLAERVDLFPYIDRRRIAIWGPTSTSAYVALATAINDDTKLIQCSVAVSPITNWLYMSSHTAERYLGLPWLDSNRLKYDQSNLVKRSYEFSMRKLLIIHGTANEQVHIQNTMQFIKSLSEHYMAGGVIHQMQIYPDIGHSLEQVKRHYYLTLDGFIDRCFYQKPIAIKATEWRGKVRPKLY